MVEANLRRKAKRGIIWNTVERIVTNGIHFVLTIVLARLLSPNDYGIIAMPAIFLAIAQVFVDSGFANALIRKPDLNERDLSTAFYFNILVGLVSYILLFFLSPFIAEFFNTPLLSNILKVTALVVFLNSLGIVQQALMTKRMDFKTQAVISAISTFLSGGVGIWMAYGGYGVWALVFQQVSSALLRNLLLWFLGGWKPLMLWSNDSFKYLWNFGSKVVVIGLLESLFNNVYAFVIGKKYQTNDLGNYTRAQQFADLPMGNISSIVQKVTYPLLSEIQDDHTKLGKIYMSLVEMMSVLVIPLMFGLAAIACPLIIILLGAEWKGCVLMFQILCVARIWTPFSMINVNLLQVKGKTDLLLKLDIVKKIVFTIIIGLTFCHGVIFLVGGFALYTFIGFIINTYYTKKIIGIGFNEQFLSVFPILLISMVSFAVVQLLIFIIRESYIQLILGVIIFLLFTISLVYIFKKEVVLEIISYIKNNRQN